MSSNLHSQTFLTRLWSSRINSSNRALCWISREEHWARQLKRYWQGLSMMRGSSRSSYWSRLTRVCSKDWINNGPHSNSSSPMQAQNSYRICRSSASSCSSSWVNLCSSEVLWISRSRCWRRSCRAWSMIVSVCSSIWKMRKNEPKNLNRSIKLSSTLWNKQLCSRNSWWSEIQVRSSRLRSSTRS